MEAAAPFVWGEGGAQLTPTQIATRRQLAQAMMAQGMDYSPIKSPWQGASRIAQSLLGTADSMSADASEEKGRRQAIADAVMAIGGGQGGAPSSSAAPAAAAPIAAVPARGPAVDTTGKIYSNDEPSPLDPPSGTDRDMAIRTIIAEAGNQPFAGQTGVAATIRNRAVDGGYGGDTVPGVIRKPFAYEPWNTEGGRDKMAAIPASDPRYATAGKALDAAYFGEDPTEGATHFVAPRAQAARGRPMPSWAQGEGTTIGDHVFYSPDDSAPAAPVRVASAVPFAPAGPVAPDGAPATGSPAVAAVARAMQPAAPAAAPGPPAAAPAGQGVDAVVRAMSNPHLPPAYAQVLAAQLKPREQHVQETDAAGNVWDVNRLTGQRTVALKKDKDASFAAPYRDDAGNLVQKGSDGKFAVIAAADKPPSSVQEFEFYRKNFKPSDQRPTPMDYETWATAKARAGAINVGNVTTNTGGSDKQIFDALDERAKEARSAATGLVALRNARAALDGAGGAITGAGADTKLLLTKVGAALGITDPKAAENTETFRAAIAPQVAAMLKSTVGTTNISNSDREFAEKAAGGSIALEGNSIKRLLDIMERASVARLQLHQEQLDAVYPDPVTHKRERALFGVKVPDLAAPPPPAGATATGVKWSVE